jgi:hypothetical protein
LYVPKLETEPTGVSPPLSLAGFWSIWCPCVVYGKNRQRLRHLQNQGAPLPGGGERYDSHCRIYAALCALTLGHGWILHVRLLAMFDEMA